MTLAPRRYDALARLAPPRHIRSLMPGIDGRNIGFPFGIGEVGRVVGA